MSSTCLYTGKSTKLWHLNRVDYAVAHELPDAAFSQRLDALVKSLQSDEIVVNLEVVVGAIRLCDPSGRMSEWSYTGLAQLTLEAFCLGLDAAPGEPDSGLGFRIAETSDRMIAVAFKRFGEPTAVSPQVGALLGRIPGIKSGVGVSASGLYLMAVKRGRLQSMSHVETVCRAYVAGATAKIAQPQTD